MLFQTERQTVIDIIDIKHTSTLFTEIRIFLKKFIE